MNKPSIPTPAVCPRCGCWYQAGVRRCLDDGSALLQADNMVRLFGPEDLSSKNATIVEVVVRGAERPTESLGEAAARLKGGLKGGPSTMLMEEPEVAAPPEDEATQPPATPLVLEAEPGAIQTTSKPDDEPPTRLVTVDRSPKPWVPLDPSEFEIATREPPHRSPRWPCQPPGRERVSFFEVPTRLEAIAEPDTEIVAERERSIDLGRSARHRRLTRRGHAITVGRTPGRTPGLTQHTPTLLRTGTSPAGVKAG